MKKAVNILKEKKIVYLQFSVRVGKTATALETCRLYGAKKVLFLTKKKAISSIESDYKDFGFTFDLTVINNESLQKITDNDFDLVIQDEAHSMGAFPKPSKRTKDFKLRFLFAYDFFKWHSSSRKLLADVPSILGKFLHSIYSVRELL